MLVREGNSSTLQSNEHDSTQTSGLKKIPRMWMETPNFESISNKLSDKHRSFVFYKGSWEYRSYCYFLKIFRAHRWQSALNFDLRWTSPGEHGARQLHILRKLSAFMRYESNKDAEKLRGLSYIQSLRHFVLTLPNFLTDEDLAILALKIRQGLFNIRKLELNFSTTTSKSAIISTSAGIETIGYSIAVNLPQLQQLSLDFTSFPNITISAIVAFFSQRRRHLGLLQQLNLKMKGCSGIMDQDVRVLAEAVRELTGLKQIEINFHDCKKISNTGLVALGTELGASSAKQQITLIFANCSQITDVGLEAFVLAIARHSTTLTQLELDFFGCYKLTKKGIEALGLELIQKLVHLQNLLLGFRNCDKITDKCVQDLATKIFGLSKLQKLYLSFRGCRDLTDRSLETIGSGIKSNLVNLRNLHLDFAGCCTTDICKRKWMNSFQPTKEIETFCKVDLK